MYPLLDTSIPNHATIWALFLMAFYIMARKSNLVPDSQQAFDASKQLTRQDIVSHSSGDCLLVTIKWSKTRQCGGKLLQLPLVTVPDSPLCPVSAYNKMVSLVPSKTSSPAFVFISKAGKHLPLSYPQYQSTLKTLISKIGKNPKNYSSHSFRRGGASYAFQANLPSEIIKLMGDWSSDAYLEYIHIPLHSRTMAAIQLSDHLQIHYSV
jgi:hypothetical protein